MPHQAQPQDLVTYTAEIVAAYIANNQADVSIIGDLINSVHGSLVRLGAGEPEPVAKPLKPAVPIKHSVTPDYIICLEDGKKFKSLRRHLRASYGLSPEEYRARWGLPADYQMTSPNCAAARSALATSSGFGNKGRSRDASAVEAP